MSGRQKLLHLVIAAAGIAAPLLFPGHTVQLAVFWIFVLFALTWDIMGGHMGYNSLGNILFFGLGMYVCALVQIGLVYDVAEYTASNGAIHIDFTRAQYFHGLALGLGVLEQYSGFVLGAQFQQATVVGLLLVILMWRQTLLRRHRLALQ